MCVFSRLLACLAAATLLVAQPAAAQSILRDAETEQLLQDMVDPLVVAAGMPRGSVEVVLIGDPSMNAFVQQGQRIYVHSGLINAADSANEVEGVLAHELGHITGGHVIRFYEGYGKAVKISMLSLLASLAAMAAGAGEASAGIMALGSQAALGSLLTFTRAQESSADAAGATYLAGAGISGKGSLAFFGKLQNREFRYGYSQDEEQTYSRTHPLSGDRIAYLRDRYEKDPAWNKPTDPDIEARFQRVKAKLYGYLAKPADTLRSYPAYVNTVPAHYARAYAYHKDARMAEAIRETDALLASDPDNPYFLELKGQVLLESGKPDLALEPLREATRLTNNNPLIAGTFGHALVATENGKHLDEAETVLRAAVAKDRENPFAWYQLGMVYGAKGDLPRARLASAEQQIMVGATAEALRNSDAALKALPEYSPDWIRAQDVNMQARAQLERERDRK